MDVVVLATFLLLLCKMWRSSTLGPVASMFQHALSILNASTAAVAGATFDCNSFVMNEYMIMEENFHSSQ